jgi:hypothetical protein
MASINLDPHALPTPPETAAPADEGPEPHFGDRIALYLLVGGFFVLAALIFSDTILRWLR